MPSSSLFYVQKGGSTRPLELERLKKTETKSTARLHKIDCASLQKRVLPSDRRWFVINGDTDIKVGTEFIGGQWPESESLPESNESVVRLISMKKHLKNQYKPFCPN